MLRFKQFLIEGVVRSVGRKIFVEPPSPNATAEFTNPLYNQIVSRPEPIKFDAFDKNLQTSWRSPREKLISSGDGAWDEMNVGSKNINDVIAASPTYKEGKTFKGYFSVADVEDPKVIERFGAAIPDLQRRLSGVADQLGTAFSFKVPKHVKTAGEHVDSIVFHHYDVPDSSLHRSIDATTRKWAADHGLELLDRQGLDTGVDIKDMSGEKISFSDQIAQKIVKGEKGSLSQIGKQILDSALVKQTGKAALKTLPVVGTAASIGAMAQRAQAGDYTGAGLEAASELADYIPGVGTAASMGIQAYLADRDKPEEEKKKQQSNLARQNLRSLAQGIR